jgi:hypothetical protein
MVEYRDALGLIANYGVELLSELGYNMPPFPI